MESRILRKDEYEERFLRDGYTKMEFLNTEERNALLQLYDNLKNDLPFHNGIHISVEMCGSSQGNRIRQSISEIITTALDRCFIDYKVFLGSFIIKKGAEERSEIGIHQDWIFVDEQKGYHSATLWMALDDVPVKRGGIGFIPGSHKDFNPIRFTPMQVYQSPFEPIKEDLVPLLRMEALKAGEAILWDHRVLHGSVPNSCDENRLVASIAITHEAAPMQMMYQLPNDNERIGIFPIDVQFMNAYNSHRIYEDYTKGEMLGGIRPRKLLRKPSMLTPEELQELLNAYQNKELRGLL